MPDLIPVENDPYAVNLVPVDNDPYAVNLQPVDYSPEWAALPAPHGVPQVTITPAQGVIPKQGQTVQPVNAAPMTGQAAMSALGVPDISTMTPDEQQMFALGAVPMLAGGPEAKVAEEVLPEAANAVQQGIRAFSDVRPASLGSLLPEHFEQIASMGGNWGSVPIMDTAGNIIHNAIAGRENIGGPILRLNVDGTLTKGIVAYHGSPYDFERFDLSKIGTGEGAQAYGHGLYFAENPQTAQSYKDALTLSQPWEPAPKGSMAAQAQSQDKTFQQLLDEGNERFEYDRRPFVRFSDGTAVEIGPDGIQNAIQMPHGKMYEVAINADPEHFLDWDKPLSEQHPKVQEILGKFGFNPDATPQSFYGEQLYSRLQNQFHQSGQGHLDSSIVSQKLRDAGIPGIKYLDQGSRLPADASAQIADLKDRISNPSRQPADPNMAAAQIAADKQKLAKLTSPQTSNYVVFDDKLIDIIKKYGLAGLIAGGAAHFKTTPVDHNPFAQQ